MRTDCHVCRSEGLSARSQVLVVAGNREVLATLYQVSGDWLAINEVGLSEGAWVHLGASEGEALTVRHPDPIESLGRMRHRIYGHRLDSAALRAIMSDIVEGRYSDVQLAAFVLSGAVSAAAGVLLANLNAFASPSTLAWTISGELIVMVVLGGMGHIPGVILGAVILTVLPEALRYGVEPLQKAIFGHSVVDPESLRMLVFGLALVLVMRFRPAGLWPSPERRH